MFDGWINANGVWVPRQGNLGGKSQTEIDHSNAYELVGLKRKKTVAVFDQIYLDYKENKDVIPEHYDELFGQILAFFGSSIFSVRSSSSLEDGELRAPGVCDTLFFSPLDEKKEMKPLEQRLKEFKVKIGAVFNSLDGYDALAFRDKYSIDNPTMGLTLSELVTDRDEPRPMFAGYVNTMLPNKVLVAVVNGLGTQAVEARGGKVYIIDRQDLDNVEGVIEPTKRNSKSDYVLCDFVMADGNEGSSKIFRAYSDIDIDGVTDLAKKAIELERALSIEGKSGIDFEFAVTLDDTGDEYTFYALQSPLIKKLPEITFPSDKPVLTSRMVLGQGVQEFDNIFILEEEEYPHNYGSLPEFNEKNRNYLLFASHAYNTKNNQIPYCISYNAGCIVDYTVCPSTMGSQQSYAFSHVNLRRVLDGTNYINLSNTSLSNLGELGIGNEIFLASLGDVSFRLKQPITVISDMEKQEARIYAGNEIIFSSQSSIIT